MSSPVQIVKKSFESKAKLVAAVEALATDELWLPRTNADRGGDRSLKHVSNAKLLRLHSMLTEVKDTWGTRDKLIAAVLEAKGKTKDEGYKKRIEQYPVPRLLDLYKSRKKG